MTSRLMEARDAFSANCPEERRRVRGREWGVIGAGASGPPLVLLPGTLGRADIFWQQIGNLSGEARLLALSYPDSGGIADWAGDIAELIREYDMTGATILGSSLGGYVAQFLAAAHPEACGGLVAANSLADASIVRAMPPYSLDLVAIGTEELRAGFLSGLRTWETPDNPYADLAGLLIREVRGRISDAELRRRLIALKEAPPLPAQTLSASRVFTIESDDDHLIPPPVREGLRKVLQPGRAYRFTAASHFPYVTRPGPYSDLIREVLGLPAPGSDWPAGSMAVY